MINNQVEEAYTQCEEVIKENSKTFYTAFSMLPPKHRKAVWAVYAFCRQVDDIVDVGKSPREDLQRFELEFTLFKKGELVSESAMWIALCDVFKRYEMNIQAFDDMIIGQKMDLIKKEYHTLDEVETYSYHVASTVGLMLLPILAPTTHQELEEGAIALGIGMQLTNILRDIGEDWKRERIYLPKELMNSYGYTRSMLENQQVTSEFIQVWEYMAREAEAHYKIGLQSIDKYPIASRLTVKGAAYLYQAILNKIREEDY